MPHRPADVDEALDYLAITRLQASYADVVTRRAWDELADLLLPDAAIAVDTMTAAPLELAGPEQLGSFIASATDRFDFFEFIILNTVIDVASADTATGRMYISEIRHGVDGAPSQTFGVYRDDYRKVEQRWWFARRRYQSLYRLPAGDVFEFPAVERGTIAGDHDVV